jgi:predicted membrane protein
MNGLLGQMALGLSVLLFLVVLVISFLAGVPMLEAACRAAAVFLGTAFASMLFLRFMMGVVYRFIAEKMIVHGKAKDAKRRDAEARPSATTPLG